MSSKFNKELKELVSDQVISSESVEITLYYNQKQTSKIKRKLFVVFTLITLLISTSCRSVLFFKQESQAKKFMKQEIEKNYGERFKINRLGAYHEFGKIYGFQIKIVDDRNNPIYFFYNLPFSKPLYFDKAQFEKNYTMVSEVLESSEELEEVFKKVFSSSRALSNKIETKDSAFRWVHNIYTAVPLDEKNKTLEKVDSICRITLGNYEEFDLKYNLYFTKKEDTKEYSNNKGKLFSYDNLEDKCIIHYRVDFKKDSSGFKIVDHKLMNNINEKVEKGLKNEIRKWIIKNNTDYDQKGIWLLHEEKVDRDIQKKKFLFNNNLGEKRFGFINIETKEIDLLKQNKL
ncbi:hypothetical protein [uncultured Aquimarina sp.]|uniref:hypothetical protein n=1 Tax=uncultured Aquimarina sp. TaxID=575652 RepID=UPI00261A7377|nr:hypothetical protein [uncultured Aquimarina sp.]